MKKNIFVWLCVLFPVSVSVLASQAHSYDPTPWQSHDKKLEAIFPSDVERVALDTSEGGVVGYISVQKSAEGGVVYQISRYGVPEYLTEYKEDKALERLVLEKASIKDVEEGSLETGWKDFGGNIRALMYEQEFEERGVVVFEKGFVVKVDDEFVEVKVQATGDLVGERIRNFERFFRSFSIND